MMTVYGVPGWGSAISELMLTLANIPYHFVNVAGFDQPGRARQPDADKSVVSGADPAAGRWQRDDRIRRDCPDDPR